MHSERERLRGCIRCRASRAVTSGFVYVCMYVCKYVCMYVCICRASCAVKSGFVRLLHHAYVHTTLQQPLQQLRRPGTHFTCFTRTKVQTLTLLFADNRFWEATRMEPPAHRSSDYLLY